MSRDEKSISRARQQQDPYGPYLPKQRQPPEPLVLITQKGDDFYRIARDYFLEPRQLRRVNLHLCDPQDLKGGEALVIPLAEADMREMQSFLVKHAINDAEPRRRFGRLMPKSRINPKLLMRCPPPEEHDHPLLGVVSKMVPGAPKGNINKFLPAIITALNNEGIGDNEMLLMAIATVRAESSTFAPLDEGVSHLNTTKQGRQNKHYFDIYDNKLGNGSRPDGERYKGRGFIQLTGRSNYRTIGASVGLGDQLERDPERANSPEVATKILASFLKKEETRIREALRRDDLTAARKAVNGGSHGLTEFKAAFNTGKKLLK